MSPRLVTNDCELCDGTGFDASDDDGAKPCPRCRVSITDKLASAGVPAKLRSYTRDGLNESQRERWSAIEKAVMSGASVLLRGAVGVGKTGLAVAMLRERAEAGKSIAWCHVDGWLREVREGFDRGGDERLSERAMLDSVTAPDVAVIDDLGAGSLTGWARDMVYALVHGRDVAGGVTLYTTNLALGYPPKPGDDASKTILGVYGERVASRLSSCVRLAIKGPDRRPRGLA